MCIFLLSFSNAYKTRLHPGYVCFQTLVLRAIFSLTQTNLVFCGCEGGGGLKSFGDVIAGLLKGSWDL